MGGPTGSGVSTLSVVNCAMRCWYAARATPGITPAPASAAAGLVQSVRPLCQRSVMRKAALTGHTMLGERGKRHIGSLLHAGVSPGVMANCTVQING